MSNTKAPAYTLSKHTINGFAAVISGTKATIVGAVRKDAKYGVATGMEVVASPTIEELKTLLTQRGIEFKEPTVSQ
jgi:hypothetical protein